MSLFSSKLFLILLILTAALVVLVITGRKSAHAEVIVSATPDAVWNVLSDLSQYKQWNTVLIPVEGQLQKNQKIKYEFTDVNGNKSIIPSTVKQIIPNQLLNQAGGLPLVLTFDHQYILQAEEDKTKIIIHEEYHGIGVHFWDPEPVEKAYQRLAKALAEHVQKQK